MDKRDFKRQIGEEVFRFTNGEEVSVNIHAVGNYFIGEEKKRYRSTKFDKKGKIEKVEFNDADFYLKIASLSIGTQIPIEDLKYVDNIEWKDFYEKYFDLTAKKKQTLPDTQDLKQDSQLKE